MKYDLVIKNGFIHTMDSDFSVIRWMALKDGIIQSTGTRDDFSGNADTVIDLQNKIVLPGLIDSHVHSSMTGIGNMGIDLSGMDTCQKILDAVELKYKSMKNCSALCGCNMLLPADMKDKRVPTAQELDEVTGDIPVMLVFWTAHGGIMNSAAIARSDLLPEMEYVKKDGYFNEDKVSFHIIGNIYNLLTTAEFQNLYHSLADEALSKGVTTIHNLDGMMVKDDRDVKILMGIRDTLPIEFVPYTQTFDYQKVHDEFLLPRIGGCIAIDGSPPQFTAAYEDPYPCNPTTRGFLNYTDKELYDFVTAATKLDMQCAFHAIGDRAIDQIIHIYQQVDREIGIRHLRHRIEHFSLPSEKHMEMAAEMGLVISTQPAIGDKLALKEKNLFENFVSPEKAKHHENYKRMLEHNLLVMGSSDSPCSPFDPFLGINCCVNPNDPSRAIDLNTAIKMYTWNGAYGCHKENIKGSLEIGKQADFIILNKDIFKDSSHISVDCLESTWVKGKKLFSK